MKPVAVSHCPVVEGRASQEGGEGSTVGSDPAGGLGQVQAVAVSLRLPGCGGFSWKDGFGNQDLKAGCF